MENSVTFLVFWWLFCAAFIQIDGSPPFALKLKENGVMELNASELEQTSNTIAEDNTNASYDTVFWEIFVHLRPVGSKRRPCINLGDEGCVNGSLPHSGSDNGYLTGDDNPGK